MDHSLSGYLRRKTTQELEKALQEYSKDENKQKHAIEIQFTLEELERRRKENK